MDATVERPRRTSWRARSRPYVTLTLLVVWALVPLTALIAHLAREDSIRHRGLGGGITAWTEVHWWLGIVAVAVTILHLTINWAIVKGQLARLIRG
jgi:hypothetical protein